MATDTDSQDLVKALDAVANATPGSLGTTPVPASGGAVASPFDQSSVDDMPTISSVSSSISLGDNSGADVSAVDTTLTSVPAFEPATPTLGDEVSVPIDTSDLDAIKQDALGELRPLVDKLNVSSEEKFDTYLLLIRSTDDKRLIAPAHEAAKAIEDETKRAEALLNIIKEIDYLSRQS